MKLNLLFFLTVHPEVHQSVTKGEEDMDISNATDAPTDDGPPQSQKHWKIETEGWYKK